MRKQNPFTPRQLALLEAIRDKIHQINDPAPEIITDETFEWYTKQTSQFGIIPKIRFRPYSCQIKANLVRKAGLFDDKRELDLIQLRKKYGIGSVRNMEARLFESEWNNIMLKIKKATLALGYINLFFAEPDQNLSGPIRIMQQIVMEEFAPQFKANPKQISKASSPEKAETPKNNGFKPYGQQLAELE